MDEKSGVHMEMTLQTKIVMDKKKAIKKELREQFRGIPFKIRVIIHRGRIDVCITCAERYDQERLTSEMIEDIHEIARRYSEKTEFTEKELFTRSSYGQ